MTAKRGNQSYLGHAESRPALLRPPVSYFDTIRLALPFGISVELESKLKASVARKHDSKERYIKGFPSRRDGSRVTMVKLHQPTLQTLDVLDEQLNVFSIVRVDVAVDLDVANFEKKAESLGRYVARRLLLRNSKTQTPMSFERRDGPNGKRLERDDVIDECDRVLPPPTVYFDREVGKEAALRKRGREAAVYWDKESKVRDQTMISDSQPCVHVEVRTIGAASLREAGLNTTDGLRALDFKDFWRARIRLLTPPSQDELAKWLAKDSSANSQASLHGPDRLASLLLRSTSIGNSIDGATHDLLYWLRKPALYRRNVIRLFHEESHEWMLPSELNALWGLNL